MPVCPRLTARRGPLMAPPCFRGKSTIAHCDSRNRCDSETEGSSRRSGGWFRVQPEISPRPPAQTGTWAPSVAGICPAGFVCCPVRPEALPSRSGRAVSRDAADPPDGRRPPCIEACPEPTEGDGFWETKLPFEGQFPPTSRVEPNSRCLYADETLHSDWQPGQRSHCAIRDSEGLPQKTACCRSE